MQKNTKQTNKQKNKAPHGPQASKPHVALGVMGPQWQRVSGEHLATALSYITRAFSINPGSAFNQTYFKVDEG